MGKVLFLWVVWFVSSLEGVGLFPVDIFWVSIVIYFNTFLLTEGNVSDRSIPIGGTGEDKL